jgi:lipopolysaccharide export system protein LptA
MVQCDGGFLFTHTDGFIRASSGVYQKKNNFASATGNVVAADSQNTYAFFGEHLTYDRKEGILTMPDKPILHQYEMKGDSIDTLSIKAKKIVYHKKNEFASAFREVKIQQEKMLVTCDTAYFDKKNNWMSLSGNPICHLENEMIQGDSIYLVLEPDGKSLKSALVIRNAHGKQVQKGKGRQPAQHTEAFGDTLFVEFEKGKIKHLYVNVNAKGFFFEEDLPDYKNLMDGNRLDIYFEKGKVNKAIVGGNAQSTYFYVKENRSVSGRNESSGDTIQVDFKDGKVGSLRMIGGKTLASGRYFDLEKSVGKEDKRKEFKRDSTIVRKPESERRRNRMERIKKNQVILSKDSLRARKNLEGKKSDE